MGTSTRTKDHGRPRFRYLNRSNFFKILLLVATMNVAILGHSVPHHGSTRTKGTHIKKMRNDDSFKDRNNQSIQICNTPECHTAAEYIKNSMNLTVDPCDDFYQYVCGQWEHNNQYRLQGTTIYFPAVFTLRDKSSEFVGNILNNGTNSTVVEEEFLRMPVELYKSCMDIATIENLGDAPLRELIQKMGYWCMDDECNGWNESNWNFTKVLLSIHKDYSKKGPLFSVNLDPDPRNSSKNIIMIDQAGIKLPMNAYSDNKTVSKYKTFIVDVGKLLYGNQTIISTKAQDIIDFETQLQGITVSATDKENLWYEMRSLSELETEAPGFGWFNYLKEMFAPANIDANETINVPAMPYLKKVMGIVHNTSKSTLANYLVWHGIQDQLYYLSQPYRDAYINFQNSLYHSSGDLPLETKCVGYAADIFADVLGAIYINSNLTHHRKTKNMVTNLTNELQQTFTDNLDSASWTDKTTKSKIIEKVDAMVNRIGFPEYLANSTQLTMKLEKFRGMNISNNKYLSNRLAIRHAEQINMIKSLRKPIDKERWMVAPYNLVAQYWHEFNQMTLSALLFQPPFLFPDERLRSVNLGSLGSVIGHEITHGFDNKGSLFDKNGKQTTNWWTDSSLQAFKNKSRCFVDQYSRYIVLGTKPISGERTLAENLADNGGLNLALKLHKDKLRQSTSHTWKLPGLTNFTDDQLFFISHGQTYCTLSTDFAKRYITDYFVNPIDEYRLNGTLSNSYEFANAFHCSDTSRMNPPKKCSLWFESQ